MQVTLVRKSVRKTKTRPVQWQIAMRPGKRKALPDTPEGKLLDQLEYLKAKVRAKVEHHVSRGEKPLLASQDPLSWPGEKHRVDVQPVWASQSAAGQVTFDAC